MHCFVAFVISDLQIWGRSSSDAGLRAIQPQMAFKMRFSDNIVPAARTLSSTSYPGIRLSRFPREFFTCTKRTRRRVSRRVLYEARCCVSHFICGFFENSFGHLKCFHHNLIVGWGQPFTDVPCDHRFLSLFQAWLASPLKSSPPICYNSQRHATAN